MQFLVYGAGAVGSVLGGMLSVHRHDVRLVGREAHVDAIAADGLRIKSATGEYVAHPTISKHFSNDMMNGVKCVILAVKSQDLAAALDTVTPALSGDLPVLCIQNGIESEKNAGERVQRVYGAVVRMTCSMVQPGHVSFQSGGRVVVGKYPRGADAFARSLAAAITEAGFDSVV